MDQTFEPVFSANLHVSEHMPCVCFVQAVKNKMDLAIGVALGSSIQIAIFGEFRPVCFVYSVCQTNIPSMMNKRTVYPWPNYPMT